MNINNNHNLSGNGASNGHNNRNDLIQLFEEETEPDYRKYALKLWRNKWIVIGCLVVCTILGYVIASTLTPIYRSHGTLLVARSGSNITISNKNALNNLLASSYGIGQGTTIGNQLFILRSRFLANEVADTLRKIRTMPNGKQYPILYTEYPSDSSLASKEVVTERLRGKIDATQTGMYGQTSASAIKISYQSPSAVGAASIVNLTMDVYQNISMHQNRKSALAAVHFLKHERNRIKKELHQAQQELQIFRKKKGLIQVDDQTSEIIERIANLETKKQEAKVKLKVANSAFQQYKERLNTIKPGLASQFINDISPEMQRLQYILAEAKTKKAQLKYNYNLNNKDASGSKRLKKLNDKIDYYEDQIRELTQQLVKNTEQAGYIATTQEDVASTINQIKQKLIKLQVKRQQYEAQIKALGSKLEEMKSYFNNLPGYMTSLARLTQKVEVKRQLFMTVSKKFAQTSLWLQTQLSPGRVIDAAQITDIPVKPQKKIFMLVGFLFGGLIALGYIFGKDTLDNSVNSIEDLKSSEVPLLGTVPDMTEYIEDNYEGEEMVVKEGYEVSTDLSTIHTANSTIAESYRRIETNIINSNPDLELNTLMVTSSNPGEGKTTSVMNLGAILAESGQEIILVEADLHRPKLRDKFSLNYQPGLTDRLFDKAPFEEVIHSTAVPNLDLLPSGELPSNQAAVMKSTALADCIKELNNRYDYVLLDTAPYGIVSDASPLARLSDGIIVVVEFDETLEVQFNNTIEELQRINGNVLGTVVTHYDYNKSSDYYYGYNSYYKYAYSNYESYKQ